MYSSPNIVNLVHLEVFFVDINRPGICWKKSGFEYSATEAFEQLRVAYATS